MSGDWIDVGVYQKRPGGRWHVATRTWRGIWQPATIIGYRTQKRAQARANKIAQKFNRRKSYREALQREAEARSDKISERIDQP